MVVYVHVLPIVGFDGLFNNMTSLNEVVGKRRQISIRHEFGHNNMDILPSSHLWKQQLNNLLLETGGKKVMMMTMTRKRRRRKRLEG